MLSERKADDLADCGGIVKMCHGSSDMSWAFIGFHEPP